MKRPDPIFPSPLAVYLTGAEVIVTHGITHQRFLAEQDTTLTPEWLHDFRQRITQTRNDVLGADNKSEQREATDKVISLQNAILPRLKSVMNIIENKFTDSEEEEAQEALNVLGYTPWWRRASRSKSQTALVELLKEFKANLTPARRARLETKGANPAYIDDIFAYADSFDKQNIIQETRKGQSLLLTDEDILKVNAIHLDLRTVMSAGTNAARFNPSIRPLFNLSKIMDDINGKR